MPAPEDADDLQFEVDMEELHPGEIHPLADSLVQRGEPASAEDDPLLVPLEPMDALPPAVAVAA